MFPGVSLQRLRVEIQTAKGQFNFCETFLAEFTALQFVKVVSGNKHFNNL